MSTNNPMSEAVWGVILVLHYLITVCSFIDLGFSRSVQSGQ